MGLHGVGNEDEDFMPDVRAAGVVSAEAEEPAIAGAFHPHVVTGLAVAARGNEWLSTDTLPMPVTPASEAVVVTSNAFTEGLEDTQPISIIPDHTPEGDQ